LGFPLPGLARLALGAAISGLLGVTLIAQVTIPPSRTVSVLLVDVTVASNDCWLLMVKSAVDAAVMPCSADSVASASWYAADRVSCEVASR